MAETNKRSHTSVSNSNQVNNTQRYTQKKGKLSNGFAFAYGKALFTKT
jgi:hypothetical protein